MRTIKLPAGPGPSVATSPSPEIWRWVPSSTPRGKRAVQTGDTRKVACLLTSRDVDVNCFLDLDMAHATAGATARPRRNYRSGSPTLIACSLHMEAVLNHVGPHSSSMASRAGGPLRSCFQACSCARVTLHYWADSDRARSALAGFHEADTDGRFNVRTARSSFEALT